MRKAVITFMMCLTVLTAMAQRAGMSKLSPWLRMLASQEMRQSKKAFAPNGGESARDVIAFVRIREDADEVLKAHNSRSLACVGNIHIASIPLSQLGKMATDQRVVRIEAQPSGQVWLDSLSHAVNSAAAHEGQNLPQAYRGEGVVVGLMDIGFDLTQPNFYSRDLSRYRIQQLWDMLDRDTIGSPFIVGRDYTTQQQLLSLGRTYDGLDCTHGTHTLGIAAGSGYDTVFQGMAPESDICLVANGVVNNAHLIDSTMLDRFTFATDALGFKYIFDYAKSVNKPCVISFSEGSGQDFWGYDQLYYEVLDSMTGPGRILVAAAGNQGTVKSWFRKEPGLEAKGTFLRIWGATLMCTLKSADDFHIRVVSYSAPNDTLYIPTHEVLASPDSLYKTHLGVVDSIEIQAYPNCYNAAETCYDLTFYGYHVGFDAPLSVEMVGREADVEFWRVNGNLMNNSLNPRLDAGETTHNIHSPSSAPCVISVGATSYRDSLQNQKGEWKRYWQGPLGKRVDFSSMGPTMDGRVKPDVVAPGNNVVSSYSSFFQEQHPGSSDLDWNVAEYEFNGRTYSWTSNSGTSQACPAVAGGIALWLQACPTLTPQDVMGVIARTSRHYDSSQVYPNNEYGYGEIDIYRGLLDILGVDRIKEVSVTHTCARISVSGRQMVATMPEPVSEPCRLRLFNLSGHLLKEVGMARGATSCELSLAGLTAGIYAIQIDGAPTVRGSTLIRVR